MSEFLNYQRGALIGRLQGLTDAQARMTPTASSLSLLSLVKHSATWERRWFQIIVAGRSFSGEWPEVPDVDSEEVDTTFRLGDEDTIETVVADYREQIAASNEIWAASSSTGRVPGRTRSRRTFGGLQCT